MSMSEEHRHTLAGYSFDASQHRRLEQIRPVGEEELARITSAVKQVGDFAANSSLYEICDANYKELTGHYEKVRSEYQATHNMEDPIGSNILTELNRLLMNYLSSYKSMIDHYQTRYTRLDRQGTKWLQSFKLYTSKHYEFSFAYFYKLRDYVQHCGLPLGGVNAGFHRDERGGVVTEFSVYFDRDKLLSTSDRWHGVRRDLQAQPQQTSFVRPN